MFSIVHLLKRGLIISLELETDSLFQLVIWLNISGRYFHMRMKPRNLADPDTYLTGYPDRC